MGYLRSVPGSARLKVIRYVVLGVLALAGLLLGASLLPAPFAWPAMVAVGVVALGVVAFVIDMIVPGFDWFSRARTRFDPSTESFVVLTFDDGPIEPFTRQVLDALDAEGVKATFFCIGHNVRENPELAAEIARRGHDVGNHGDTHALLPLVSTEKIRHEIGSAADSLERATGQRPVWLRCPKGYKSRRVQSVAAELGHELIGFSYPVYDMQNPPPAELTERVVSRAQPGDILLMHDGHAPTKNHRADSVVAALPDILRGLKRRGLQPVSLSQAFERQVSGRPEALAVR